MLRIAVFMGGPNCFCCYNADLDGDNLESQCLLPTFETEAELRAFVKKIGAELVKSPWFRP